MAAITRLQSSAEKKDDVNDCCACCISSRPGCALLTVIINSNNAVSPIYFLMLETYLPGDVDYLLSCQDENILQQNTARGNHFGRSFYGTFRVIIFQ